MAVSANADFYGSGENLLKIRLNARMDRNGELPEMAALRYCV